MSKRRFWLFSLAVCLAFPVQGEPDYNLVRGSDGYDQHRDALLLASQNLIVSGVCTRVDILLSGWWATPLTSKSRPIYYTTCGGASDDHRIYLNAATGAVYRPQQL